MNQRCMFLAAAAGAAVVIVMGIAVGAGSVSDHVVISEVLPNPVGADGEHEWIELYNPTGEVVDISGWTGGSTDSPDQFTIPEGTSMGAYTCYLIGGREVFLKDHAAKLTLANTGEDAHIILRTELGTIVDTVGWDSSSVSETAPCGRPGESQSLQRKVNDTIDSDGIHGPGWDTDDNAADFFIGAPDPRCSEYDPVPPLPERAPLILFAIGLCMLAGYMLRARRRTRRGE
ncbi:MAG: lamin tail domain-containing protein [Candidatus Methanospirareceae archaeon]